MFLFRRLIESLHRIGLEDRTPASPPHPLKIELAPSRVLQQLSAAGALAVLLKGGCSQRNPPAQRRQTGPVTRSIPPIFLVSRLSCPLCSSLPLHFSSPPASSLLFFSLTSPIQLPLCLLHVSLVSLLLLSPLPSLLRPPSYSRKPSGSHSSHCLFGVSRWCRLYTSGFL